ncbi:MAG: hypothetical protein GQF41_3827 [Candidatus Rifleibacterium amylolyticum]|nr:MAG: hypothetical protein GQF41_3827 [Candidatus Rifleibacterium amylolyticum]
MITNCINIQKSCIFIQAIGMRVNKNVKALVCFKFDTCTFMDIS